MFSLAVKYSTKSSKQLFKFAPRLLATIRFTQSHEYIRLDGEVGTVGITKFAADALGDVVFVDLPTVGAKYSAGDSFGSVESVKAASDVYLPVKGEIVSINSKLDDTPGTVNESPLEDGWFVKVKVDNFGKAEFEKLLDEKAYKAHVESQAH